MKNRYHEKDDPQINGENGNNDTLNRHNPFERIEIRWLLLLLIITQFGLIAFVEGPTGIPIEGYISQLILIAWALIIIRKHDISMTQLMGKTPQNMNWLPIIGLTVTLLVYAIGAIAAVIYPIYTLNPDFATKLLDAASKNSPIHTLILGVFIAPIVEEIIFRGFLLNRIGTKWNIRTAIILSSLIFALGHSIFFIGAFVIGIVFCLLYIKTKTLLVPMSAHVLYNSIVWLGSLVSQETGGFSSEYWLQFLYQGLVAILISSPIIFIIIIRWWPLNSTTLPYDSNR